MRYICLSNKRIVSFIRETPELRTRQRKRSQTSLKKRRQFDGAGQIWTEPLFQNGGCEYGLGLRLRSGLGLVSGLESGLG